MKKLIIVVLLLFASSAIFAQVAVAPLTVSVSKLTTVAPFTLSGKSNLVISGDSITGGTIGIQLNNCSNITITNCQFQGQTLFAIYLLGCSNITIKNNYVANVGAGIYAQLCTGGINVSSNYMLNMKGPLPHADFIQFSQVSGANNLISHNNLEDLPGQSNAEDAINLYKCNGTAASPITVSYNFIRGGGPSTTGSGITVADQGGSYELVTNNTVINSGYIGMQVAGGTYITMTNNNIYSAAFPYSHLGLGYGNYSGVASNNVTISNNNICWMSALPSDLKGRPAGTTQVEFDKSYQSTLTQPTGWTTNVTVSPLPTTSPLLTSSLAVLQ